MTDSVPPPTSHEILAVVLRRRGGPLQIESLEMEGPKEDEVLVRLVAWGICRIDIDFCDHWYDGEDALVLRSVPGDICRDPFSGNFLIIGEKNNA
jgi:hypothetical protein